MAKRGRAEARLQTVSLETDSGEASDLLAVEDEEGLRRFGWDSAFWTVVDEAPIECAVALVGHDCDAAPSSGWELRHLDAKLDGKKGSTEDAEACARYDGFIYVLGSHFGSKEGPLERERAFVARFHESELERAAGGKKIRIEMIRDQFLLHRVLNDALDEIGPPLLELGAEIEHAFVGDPLKRGRKKGKTWARRLHPGDVPLNVEGAAFRPGGGLLIGFRFPVTAEGGPVIAEVDGLPELFAGRPNRLQVRCFWTLDGVGSREAPEGVRALELHGSDLQVITGSLDSVGKDSLLVGDFAGAAKARCDHRTAELPSAPSRDRPGTRSLSLGLERSFANLRDVEGVSLLPDGRFAYVIDEEGRVELRLAASGGA
jgi:hypothetical protein